MRLLPVALLLAAFSAGAIAQVPQDASAKAAAASPAAAKFKELAAKQAERKVPRGDTKARDEMLAARAADLEGFVKEFGTSTEANKARIELAQIASVQGSEENKTKWIDQAIAHAISIDDRLELAGVLKGQLKASEAADKLIADAEAGAKTDDEKATIMMHKATMVRRADRNNKAAYAEALDALVKAYPNTKVGKVATSKLAAANLKPGSDPVAFTTKDMEGKSVSPSDYKGKVLLIDFWATWCGPCMQELPNVLKAYEEYHPQGFEILGVSLDREEGRAKLESTIKERGMSWRHIYDGKFWQAEIAVMHDINSIPATILIGKDGKVVGMNLRGEKLATAVKEALEAK